MSIWTIRPEVVKVDLTYVAADGTTHPFWVTIRKRLTVGEERRVTTAGWRGMSRGVDDAGTINIDWKAANFARTEAYLTDWSLLDDDAKKLAVTREVIESLDGDVYALIEGAITKHVEAVAEEKKLRSGSASASATSA
jgi:hypothetical protein